MNTLSRWAAGLGMMAVVCLAEGQSGATTNSLASGMWVWSSEAYSGPTEQAKLLDFCRRFHFNHLEVHVQIKDQDGTPRLVHEQELREFLPRAAEARISVLAMRGSPEMFFAKNHERTLRDLAAIRAFNDRLPAASRFRGIKYDVEPQTLDAWRAGGTGREKIMREYLQCLEKLRAALRASPGAGPKFILSADIPYWWDKDELRIEVAGENKRFSEHVQDRTDSVTLMSYRRDPEQVKQAVKNEADYAALTGKTVMAGLLHSQARNPAEASLSFYGLSTAEYLRARADLETWAASQPGMGGVMHHHYGSLRARLDELAPKVGGE